MSDDATAAILDLLRERGAVQSREVAQRLGVSRQAAHSRLRALVEAGQLVSEGRGRAHRYRLARAPARVFTFRTAGLDEHVAWRELARSVPAVGALENPARSVVQYAVTELINNAIDHSGAETVTVAVGADGERLAIEVIDEGVGAFEHVRAELGLASELEALQEISKGKTTTKPDRHSGEGLFFTSKAVDHFELQSGALRWIVDGERADMTVGPLEPPRRGTYVRIELDPRHARELRSLFDEYTEDLEFSRTRTVVKLFAIGVEFISRSEAKRLLHGLEKFREVVLDFTGVEMVGQGFADEVFRVWQRDHPDVRLSPVNMSETVSFMVGRALRAR